MIPQKGDKRIPKKRKTLAESLGRTQVPNVVLTSPKLSPEARLLYANLKRFDDLEKGAYPGRDKLGLVMGMHPNTVDKYLKELLDFGLVKKKRRGGKKTNKFELVEIDDDMVRKLDPMINAYQNGKNHDTQEGEKPEDEKPDNEKPEDDDSQEGVNHENDSQGRVNQKDDSQGNVNHDPDDSQRVVNHDSQGNVNHDPDDSQRVVNKKERASFYKKRAVESMLAKLKSNSDYQKLVSKYEEEFVLKALKAFANDINKGKIKPDYPINYFLKVCEDRYILPIIFEGDEIDAGQKEAASTEEPENSSQDKPDSPEEGEKIKANQGLIEAEVELSRINFAISKLQESNHVDPKDMQELEERLQQVERDIQQLMKSPHIDPKDKQELKAELEERREQLEQTKEKV